MNWLKQSTVHYVSEDGRYEMRGGYHANGNFWNAFYVPTGELLYANHDKGIVKELCQRHAENARSAA
ncbi:MAG: hypothetical protein ACT4O5_15760 [Gammaproteobacteria bacterium]